MENSEVKPVNLRLKVDLVSYPARAEGLVNIYIYIYMCVCVCVCVCVCLCACVRLVLVLLLSRKEMDPAK